MWFGWIDGDRNACRSARGSRRVQLGTDKAKLADAKAQYDELKQSWADASAAATRGNLGDAMRKALPLKDVIAKLMESLGIKP